MVLIIEAQEVLEAVGYGWRGFRAAAPNRILAVLHRLLRRAAKQTQQNGAH